MVNLTRIKDIISKIQIVKYNISIILSQIKQFQKYSLTDNYLIHGYSRDNNKNFLKILYKITQDMNDFLKKYVLISYQQKKALEELI